METIARELGNVAFAVAVAWYLLTVVAKKLDALADEIRSLRFSLENHLRHISDHSRISRN